MKMIISAALALLFVLSLAAPASAAAHPDVGALLGGTVRALCGGTDNDSVEAYLDSIAPDAGTTPTDWFFITLRILRPGPTGKRYAKALKDFDASSENAVSRQRIALAKVFAGDLACADTVNETAGKLGVMSWIWALITADAALATGVDRSAIVSGIVGAALPAGGWTLFGAAADVDVTAMAITALSPYVDLDPAVASAVDAGLGILSARQNADGGYSSMGAANCESASQVLLALSSLGIDAAADPRFIKNGSSVLDAVASFADGSGLFRHSADGGADYNATAQAFYALTAYRMMKNAEGRLFEPYGAPNAELYAGTLSASDAATMRCAGRLCRLLVRMIRSVAAVCGAEV